MEDSFGCDDRLNQLGLASLETRRRVDLIEAMTDRENVDENQFI